MGAYSNQSSIYLKRISKQAVCAVSHIQIFYVLHSFQQTIFNTQFRLSCQDSLMRIEFLPLLE